MFRRPNGREVREGQQIPFGNGGEKSKCNSHGKSGSFAVLRMTIVIFASIPDGCGPIATGLTLADGGASIQDENCCPVTAADKDARQSGVEQVY
jgi:hypothetical protein